MKVKAIGGKEEHGGWSVWIVTTPQPLPHLTHPGHYISASLKRIGGLLCKYCNPEMLWVHRHQTELSIKLNHQEGGEWNSIKHWTYTLPLPGSQSPDTQAKNHSFRTILTLVKGLEGYVPIQEKNFIETWTWKPSTQRLSLHPVNKSAHSPIETFPGSALLPRFGNEQSQTHKIFFKASNKKDKD